MVEQLVPRQLEEGVTRRLAEEVSVGVEEQVVASRGLPAVSVTPRTSTIGSPSDVSPDTSAAAAASSSASGTIVAFNSRPNRSCAPLMSTTPSKPATPTATPMLPRRNGRPCVSVITTPIPPPNASASASLMRACRRVRVERHEERGVLGAVGVRSVDGRVRRHEPETVAHEQGVRHCAHDLGGFLEDELDELRILLGELGQLPGAGRGLHGAEVDGAALRLRDDLARDHHDVAGLRRERRLRQHVDHQGREVVAGLHHRDPGHADERSRWARPWSECRRNGGLALRTIMIYRDVYDTDELHERTLVEEEAR